MLLLNGIRRSGIDHEKLIFRVDSAIISSAFV
jgi:hypothetical protein